MPINTPRRDYDESLLRWEAGRDCYKGSHAIKKAGPKYLLPLDSMQGYEKGGHNVYSKGQQKYNEYVQRAIFYNAVGRTVDGLAGAIFQKAPVYNVPPEIADQQDDVTLTKMSGDLFGLMTAKEILTTGRAGILVEMAPVNSGAPNPRPYWIGYIAENIISWRVDETKKLIRVVLREWMEAEDPKDSHVTIAIEQYRVLELIENEYVQTTWRRTDETKEDSWAVFNELTPVRKEAPLPFIPFVFVGATAVTTEIHKGPLEDLVEINLAHYRLSADMAHGLHCAALPTPWVSGVKTGGEPLYMGSGKAWVLDKGGSAGMLEVAGPGFSSISAQLARFESMMATLGARMLEQKSDMAETATAINMRHAGEHATLRMIAQVLEQALTLALQYHAWWAGNVDLPENVNASVELNKDFWSVMMTSNDLKALVLALQADTMSYETFYQNLRAGGWTREGVTAAQELKEIQRTGPVAVAVAKQGGAAKGNPKAQEGTGATAAAAADDAATAKETAEKGAA